MNESVATVTIPIPLPFQRNFGVHSTTHHTAERIMQRYIKEDADIIKQQAARLGVTVSSFIRESAVNTAKALAIQEKDNAKHDLRSG